MPLGRALFLILVLGVIAWAIMQFNIPKPFNVIAWAILLIIALVILFGVAGINTGFSF